MIDWIALSRAFPDFILTLFVVIVIIYFNRENKASSKAIMAEWRVYLAEQAEAYSKSVLEQDKLFIEHMDSSQKIFDLLLKQQEETFSTALSDIATKHQVEVSKIIDQNQLLIATAMSNLTDAVKRNSVDVRKLMALQIKK